MPITNLELSKSNCPATAVRIWYVGVHGGPCAGCRIGYAAQYETQSVLVSGESVSDEARLVMAEVRLKVLELAIAYIDIQLA
jgi:hypothetical protein